ncbi:MAG TPA: AarF/ABC1/UbiB kinase family protein [Acidimicrobiales bacterium]|nr:AarF/ABC1/UbiB kinase family protein [Acidimicrobiales bacterium]
METAPRSPRPPGAPLTVPPWSIATRSTRIVAVVVRHLLGTVLDVVRGWRLPSRRRRAGDDRGRGGSSPGAVRLRRVLEDLGPTFVKLGQVLSSRADLLPPDYQAELSRLQDAAPPEPPGTVEAVLVTELGRPWTEVFSRLDPVPLAAASIGQAHAATLVDGTDVVVKVRRPAALEAVEVDLAVLERLAAATTRWVPAARRADLAGLVGELAHTLRAELDYGIEAGNAERFARDLAGNPQVHVPRVHRHASTHRVITLDRIVGIKVSDLAALDAAGIDRPALARNVVDVVLSMVFERGFFHADPHAGNIFVEPDGRLGLVDFGMVGHLAPDVRARLGHLFVATATGDVTGLTAEVLALGTATRPVDVATLRRDLSGLLAQVTSAPLGELRVGPLLQAELAVVRRHHLRLPPELALLVKTAAMVEGLAAQLDPDFMILPAFAPYAARLLGPAAVVEPGADAPGADAPGARPPAPRPGPRPSAPADPDHAEPAPGALGPGRP